MKLQRFNNGITEWWGFGGDVSDVNAFMGIWDNRAPIDLLVKNLICGYIEPIDPFQDVFSDEPLFTFELEMLPAAGPDLIAAAALLNTCDRPSIEIDWEQLNATPERLKFQLTHKQWGCNGEQRAYEIGRFITEKNEIGLIKSIQTEVTFLDNTLRWPRGDASWFERTLGVGIGDIFLAWCLKIETLPIDGIDRNDFRVQTITVAAQWFNEIPGTVHPEIEPWREMLFLWGDDHEVRFMCPPDSLVSLWVYHFPSGNPTGVWNFGGMMKGYTQIMDSSRTYENVCREY